MQNHRVLLHISLAVIGVHWVVVLWLAVTSDQPIRFLPAEKLVVQTINLQPTEVVSLDPCEVELEPVPVPPKPTPKPAPPKPTPPKPKPIVQKTPTKKPKIDPALVSKAQQSLAKVRKGGTSNTTQPKVAALQSLNIDTKANQKEVSYRDELAARLRTLLKFPEMGAVEIQLTITRTGAVKKVQVLKTESKENEEYIAKTLPSLQMPTFGTRFGSASEHTFAITLSNE